MARDKRETETYVTETKYNKKTGYPISRRTRLNGKLQAPPDGEPSEIIYDNQGREKYINWHDRDQLHRGDGAASIDLNPENGILWVERFRFHGQKVDASVGPHTVFYDPNTGELLKQKFSDGSEIIAQNPASPLEPEL